MKYWNLYKPTPITMSEKTGHRDSQWKRVDETAQAKLRNQLQPFWTLVDLLDKERLVQVLSTPQWETMIEECIQQCKKNQQKILDLIKQTAQ